MSFIYLVFCLYIKFPCVSVFWCLECFRSLWANFTFWFQWISILKLSFWFGSWGAESGYYNFRIRANSWPIKIETCVHVCCLPPLWVICNLCWQVCLFSLNGCFPSFFFSFHFVIVLCCVLRFASCPCVQLADLACGQLLEGQCEQGLVCIGLCASCLVGNLDGFEVRSTRSKRATTPSLLA